jgi:TetR/AcrR family transcriptional regulator, cholesterol catabolism regulator
LQRFSLLVKTQLTNLYAHRKEGLFLATPNAETLPPDRKDLNKKIQRETFFIYRSEIERLLSSTGKKGDSTVAAFCTLGSIIWFLRWYNPQGKRAFDKLSDSIIKHVLYGIIGTDCPEVQSSIE